MSTLTVLRLRSSPQFAIGPSFGASPQNTSNVSQGTLSLPASVFTVMPVTPESSALYPVTLPMISRMPPSATSCFIFATEAGAAR